MRRPQCSPVARRAAHLGNARIELVLIHLAQVFLAEYTAHGLQLVRYRGIFLGQLRVIRPAVDDAQRVPALGKVELHRRNYRRAGIGKVYGHYPANGGSGLIHKPAGLAEVLVLCVLPYARDLRRAQRAAGQGIYHRPDEHLKGCG